MSLVNLVQLQWLISAIDADAIVAATAATINFFIIYSVSCEKKPPQNCKDGVNYTSVYRKVNTFCKALLCVRRVGAVRPILPMNIWV
jgi:hypothetical protein